MFIGTPWGNKAPMNYDGNLDFLLRRKTSRADLNLPGILILVA